MEYGRRSNRPFRPNYWNNLEYIKEHTMTKHILSIYAFMWASVWPYHFFFILFFIFIWFIEKKLYSTKKKVEFLILVRS